MQTQNAINWFEIPVRNMARASGFYAAVLGQTLRIEQMGSNQLAILTYQRPGVGGCLIQGANYLPSEHGAVVYLNVTQALERTLSRVIPAGGNIALGRTELPNEMGCYAHIIDTEGNRVGLHAAS